MYVIILFVAVIMTLHVSRRVGMADDADSKSVVGNHVWVQVPPPAVKNKSRTKVLLLFFCGAGPLKLLGQRSLHPSGLQLLLYHMRILPLFYDFITLV